MLRTSKIYARIQHLQLNFFPNKIKHLIGIIFLTNPSLLTIIFISVALGKNQNALSCAIHFTFTNLYFWSYFHLLSNIFFHTIFFTVSIAKYISFWFRIKWNSSFSTMKSFEAMNLTKNNWNQSIYYHISCFIEQVIIVINSVNLYSSLIRSYDPKLPYMLLLS